MAIPRDVFRVAVLLNGGGEEGLIREGRTLRVNGDRDVVVVRTSEVDQERRRVPRHQVKAFRSLAAGALGESIQPVVVKKGSCRHAGWTDGDLTIYHAPTAAG